MDELEIFDKIKILFLSVLILLMHSSIFKPPLPFLSDEYSNSGSLIFSPRPYIFILSHKPLLANSRNSLINGLYILL